MTGSERNTTMRHLLASSLVLTLMAGCTSAGLPANGDPTTVRQAAAGWILPILSGRVQLPAGFQTQATSAQVIPNANVTLMTAAGIPVAAGLTDGTGYFRIYDSTNTFTPVATTCYLLDYSKRLPACDSTNLISMRTIVQYTGNGWTSITGSTITINTTTSAMALLQAADGNVPMADCIGKITVVGAVSTVAANSPIAAAVVAPREVQVAGDLAANRDPLGDLPPCPPRVIGFASDRGGNWDYWTVKEDGTSLTNLTTGFAPSVFGGAISPNGQKVVIYANNALYVGGIDGSNLTQVSGAENVGTWVSNVQWSPDSTKLIFGAFRGAASYDVAVVNADGTGLATVYGTNDGESNPVWLSNTRVAFVSSIAGAYIIRGINLNGTGLATIVSTGANPVSEIDVAPNGLKIAYAQNPAAGGATHLRWANVDGTADGLITDGATHNSWPRWSPNGQKLVYRYRAAQGGASEIRVISADGTGIVTLPSTGRSDYNPYWSKDGTRILFTSYSAAANADEIMVMDASNGANRVNVSNAAGTDYQPSW
jgi:Tol biopolymer transport system component